jgi:hydroxymethylglutaryl-CoA reductase
VSKNLDKKKFRDMSHEERLQYIKIKTSLNDSEIDLFKNTSILKFDIIDGMIENAIGIFPLPI